MKSMQNLTRILACLLLLVLVNAVNAQDAEALRKQLYAKYSEVPNYKVNVTYEAVNDRMGFKNVQEGVLVVSGNRYILKYGSNETWLNDGNTEYVGTKEEDHSQILMFCPGVNPESVINYGQLLTFYGSGFSSSMAGNKLKLVPNGEAPYKEVHITASGNNIQSITALDNFGTAHTFNLSGFNTNTSGTQFTINKGEYYEKINEKSGCK